MTWTSSVRWVTAAGLVVCGVVSVGTGSAGMCGEGVAPELCSCAVVSGDVGTPVGWVLLSGELWLELTEVEATSGDVTGRGEGDEAGA